MIIAYLSKGTARTKAMKGFPAVNLGLMEILSKAGFSREA